MAARRREARTPDKRPRGARGPKSSGSGAARLLKLAVLVGAFVCIGFFVVLVIDVGASLVGNVRLGDTTISALWDKVVARVLDEDVPRVEPPRAPARPAARPARPAESRAEAARAPVKVASPEDDARHVAADERPDPEVARAKARLDEILGRL